MNGTFMPRGFLALAIGATVCGCISDQATAQTGLLVQPLIPQGYNRGRNVSVLTRSRPSYDALGVSVGGLLIHPQIRSGAGGTTNTYLTASEAVSSAYVSLRPSVDVSTIWSRHSLQLNASTAIRSYIGQSRRNERDWNVGATGKVELGTKLEVLAAASASRETEDPFSGEVDSGVLALSRFRRDTGSLRVDYTSGRFRLIGSSQYTKFQFNRIPLTQLIFRDQSDRDRNTLSTTAQVEYARSPSVSFFVQANHVANNFVKPLIDGFDLDSSTVRAFVGSNIDLAGRARGSLAVGYSVRNYQLASFGTLQGVALEAQIELFPKEALTLSMRARRTIEDSTSRAAGPRPFWNNSLSARADYELKRNIIASLSSEFSQQNFIRDRQVNRIYRVGGNFRYLVSRRLTLDSSISHTSQSVTSVSSTGFSENRLEVGLVFGI